MFKRLFLTVFLLGYLSVYSQHDTLNYSLYKDKIVLYSDLGFKSAPFSIKYNYPNGIKRLHYKHNIKAVLGFGIAYKWFGLRIGFSLPGELKPVSRFGRSNFTDFGVKFNIKQTFWDVDLRVYNGYVIKDAYKWNDSLTALTPNDHRPDTRTASFSINSWYFRSKQFKMQSVLGIAGDFRRTTGTWYFKSTLNFFGVGTDKGAIIPEELSDSADTKTLATAASALDLGLVPGYAYVYRKGYWQASVFGGLGGVIQSKFFAAGVVTRGFLGLAPRIDLRFTAGFSKSNYFIWLLSDFDIKSISFKDMRYTQTFYNISVCGGYRFNKKKKE